MTSMTAIKTYFGSEAPEKFKRAFPVTAVTNKELIDLKKIPREEYEALAKGACAVLGVEWEASV